MPWAKNLLFRPDPPIKYITFIVTAKLSAKRFVIVFYRTVPTVLWFRTFLQSSLQAFFNCELVSSWFTVNLSLSVQNSTSQQDSAEQEKAAEVKNTVHRRQTRKIQVDSKHLGQSCHLINLAIQ